MGEPLSLLIVEDSESDAELEVRQLAKGGFDISRERVDSAEGLRAALLRGPWDVVLCDFNLPGFGAAQALAIFKECDLDIPFIVVSGVVVEEAAIELMRLGARDFVMKANLAKLVPVVRRELSEARVRAEARVAHAALAETRRRHAIAIESAIDGYAALDDAMRFLEVNDALCAMSGRAREELLSMGFADLLADGGSVCESFLSGAGCPGSARHEGKLKRKGGSMIDVDLSFTCHRNDGMQVFLFVHDISDRKHRQAELEKTNREGERGRVALLSVLEDQREIEAALRESEENFRGILDNNVAAMFMIENGLLTYCNRRAALVFGAEPADMIGKPMVDFVSPDDSPTVASAVEKLEKGERRSLEIEFKVNGARGTVFEIGATATRAVVRGRTVILGAAQDIGERKKARQDIDGYIARLETAVEGTLTAVSHMLELRDPYTSGHQRGVGELATALGQELGLPESTVKGLRLTGFVHDIGKISAPAEILVKPTRLTSIEYELIKGHSQAGYEVLKNVTFPWPVAETILQHHERLDGSGYPQGLKGEEILLEARIISVADVVEAMSSHRPYRAALGIEAALAEIEKNAGRLYDADVAAACLRLFREKGYAIPP